MPERVVHGFKLSYWEEGKGEVIVLLHGLGGNAAEWEDQMPFFSKNFRVIAPDLRGHGQSDPIPSEKYTPFDHARDVVGLLDTLGVKRAWMVGLSAGGIVTLAVALQNPEHLHGIVIAGSAPVVDKDTLAVTARWMEALKTQGPQAYIISIIKDGFTLDFFEAEPDRVDRFIEAQKVRDAGKINFPAAGFEHFDVRPQLPKIKMPVLAIHGMNDRVVDPAYARRLRQAVVGAEVKLMDSGHFVNVEKADEFNEAVLDFISRNSRTTPAA